MNMENKKKNIGGKVCIMIVVLLYCLLQISFLVKYISNPFHLRLGTKMENKEELFQFVKDNQSELEQIAVGMKNLYEEKKEGIIIVDVFSYSGYQFKEADELIRKYKINYIAVALNDGVYEVSFDFNYAPVGYNYYGIYYSEDGQPNGWGNWDELTEENGVYTYKGSYYHGKTEQIVDNWYYFVVDAH